MIRTQTGLRVMRESTFGGEFRQMLGRDYIVIPVVALVEGVRHAGNFEHPELVLEDSFGANVGTWDGRPVVVNHPVDELGVNILASKANVLEESYLGTIMNSTIDKGKLIVETWLDIEAIKNSKSKKVTDMWSRLDNGETVEVSVGAVVYTTNETGTYGGKKYHGRWNIAIPDHLAFLGGDQVGACSVKDGCGTFRTQVAGRVQLSKGAIMAMSNAGTVKSVSSKPATLDEKDCSCKGADGKPEHLVSASEGDGSHLVSKALFGSDTFDRDRRAFLQRAITERFKKQYPYIVSFNSNTVVFEMQKDEFYRMYKISYNSTASDKVALGEEDPEEVMFKASLVTVGEDPKEKKYMSGKTKRTAELSDIDESDDAEEIEEAPRTKAKPKRLSAPATPETLVELVASLDGTPVGKALSQVMKVADTVRAKAVAHILSAPVYKNFKKDDLEGIDFAVLDKMAKTATLSIGETPAEEAALEDAPAEEIALGFMDYNKSKVPAKAATPAALAGAQQVQKTVTYGGRAGGQMPRAESVPKAPDVFAFDEGGKMK